MAAGPGRNDPCRCGSGRKTKRCCGERRGPSEAQLARARLSVLGRDAIDDLRGCTEEALELLDDDLFDLPELDLSLHVRLPELTGAERKRLQRAITADPDDDDAWATVKALVLQVDTPHERVRLAEVLLNLGDRGLIGRGNLAYALYDLSNGSMRLMTASVIHTLATHLGGDPTPGGLLVAA